MKFWMSDLRVFDFAFVVGILDLLFLFFDFRAFRSVFDFLGLGVVPIFEKSVGG